MTEKQVDINLFTQKENNIFSPIEKVFLRMSPTQKRSIDVIKGEIS